MNRSCLIWLLTPFLLVGSCCGLLTYSRALPNGHSISYANNDSCYIIDREHGVVVDDHIVSWNTDGELVRGVMSNGIEFTLDTKTSTTKYSNGIVIADGKHVKIRDFPNGYSLFSAGNSQYIVDARNFMVGYGDVLNANVEGESIITGSDESGMKFEIDTATNFYKFQIRNRDGVAWATLDENHKHVTITTEN